MDRPWRGLARRRSREGLISLIAYAYGAVEQKIKEGKMLTLFELLRCEVRNFNNGWALGSDGFTKSALQSAKRGQTPKRGVYGIRCVELAGIGTARKVRNSDAVALPK